MKRRFNVDDIRYSGIEYAEGSLEIDDESHEIVFRTMKKGFFSSKEIILETTKFDAKAFPQFEIDYLKAGNVEAWISNERDRQKIAEILSRPRTELMNRLSSNLDKAKTSLEDMLIARARSLDHLSEIRTNPRKALFETSPDLLASSGNPVDLAVRKQKDAIAELVPTFKDNLVLQVSRGEISAVTRDHFYKLALSIGATQDAVFQSDTEKLRAAEEMLHEASLAMPAVSGVSIHSLTETLISEATGKIHGTMLEEALHAA